MKIQPTTIQTIKEHKQWKMQEQPNDVHEQAKKVQEQAKEVQETVQGWRVGMFIKF